MKNGDLVTVSGRAGTVAAVIVDVRAVDDLPDVDSLPVAYSRQVRAWLIADCFQRVAVIAYDFCDNGTTVPVMFAAFEDRAGVWWDLKGHNLQIDSRRQEEAPCPARSTDSTRPN